MSVLKIFNDNAWREYYVDPTVTPASTPQFAPGEVDYVIKTGTAQTIVLSQAYRSGSWAAPTYSIDYLPSGVTLSGRTLSIHSATPAIGQSKFVVTATYSDGTTATKDYSITVYGTPVGTLPPSPPVIPAPPTPTPAPIDPTPVLSPAITNIAVNSWRYSGTNVTRFRLFWRRPERSGLFLGFRLSLLGRYGSYRRDLDLQLFTGSGTNTETSTTSQLLVKKYNISPNYWVVFPTSDYRLLNRWLRSGAYISIHATSSLSPFSDFDSSSGEWSGITRMRVPPPS